MLGTPRANSGSPNPSWTSGFFLGAPGSCAIQFPSLWKISRWTYEALGVLVQHFRAWGHGKENSSPRGHQEAKIGTCLRALLNGLALPPRLHFPTGLQCGPIMPQAEDNTSTHRIVGHLSCHSRDPVWIQPWRPTEEGAFLWSVSPLETIVPRR